MDLPGMAETQSLNSLALMFTNTSGQVIFADRNYLRITGTSAVRIVAGEPLQQILPIEPRSAAPLADMLRRRDLIEPVSISIRSATGAVWQSSTTAIGVQDEKGNFIGTDLALVGASSSDPAASPVPQLLTHADVLKAYVGMVFSEGNLLKSRTFIQSYVISQLEVMQIMLARIGGPTIRLAFENVISNTAKSTSLPILMKNGHMEFSRKDIGLQSYRAFLLSAISYAVDVIGRHLVQQEMLAVDRFMGPGTFELISQMDIRDVFPD